MAADAVEGGDGELRQRHADVHVQREGGLPPGEVAQALLEHLVAGAS